MVKKLGARRRSESSIVVTHRSRRSPGCRRSAQARMAHLRPRLPPQSARTQSPWQPRHHVRAQQAPLLFSPRTPCLLSPALTRALLGRREHSDLRLRGEPWRGRGRGRGGAGMAVAGMLGEAVKGAVREAWSVRGVGLVGRVAILVSLLGIVVREVAGTVRLAGYGAYAYWLYHVSLGAWRKGEERAGEKASRRSEQTVAVARNVRYGHSKRNLLDVYVPKREGLKPVVVFVHGGVWASGDKWQFSPLGAFLAEEGVVAVLVQYTLYPEVLAIDQVSEVSAALTWTMDNISQYGGEPNRVFLMGHSSGAHLSSMVMWERAIRRVENAQRPLPEDLDIRIPAGFLGLAGVYNIGEHFKHEMGRGVGAISCMRPAMGWEQGFDSMSPSLLFESLLTLPGVSYVADGCTDPVAQIQVRGLDLMPRCLFIVSHKDIVVPPESSFAFNSMLLSLACESRVVLHERLNHEDFVLWHRGWGHLKTHIGPYLEDVLNFVTAEFPQK